MAGGKSRQMAAAAARHGGSIFRKRRLKGGQNRRIHGTVHDKVIAAASSAVRCETALASAVGQPGPEMAAVGTFGTEQTDSGIIRDAALCLFPLSVAGMISRLDLRGRFFSEPPMGLRTGSNILLPGADGYG